MRKFVLENEENSEKKNGRIILVIDKRPTDSKDVIHLEKITLECS